MKEKVKLELRKFVAPEYIFGDGARALASDYCRKLGGIKVCLVTDPIVMKQSWFSEIADDLNLKGIEYTVFSSVTPNPRDKEVMEGAAHFNNHACNLLLAVGGGSVIDCAKGIGIVATNRDDITRFEGVDMIRRPLPPMVCIPTTSGSSADVSQFAIINKISERYKMAIISKSIVPDIALIDPYVLTTMDSFLTACTGIDALSHAFEAYVSNASSNFTDLFALEAIRLINDNLYDTITTPDDLEARGKIMLASLYAGLAFSNASLGCVHSLAHSLGGYLDLPHGECNAILLPHVIGYNFYAAPDEYTNIASTLGIETNGKSQTEIKESLTQYMFDFTHRMGITSTLTSKGITSEIIPTLASKALGDPCNATNPRTPSQKDFEIILSEAL